MECVNKTRQVDERIRLGVMSIYRNRRCGGADRRWSAWQRWDSIRDGIEARTCLMAMLQLCSAEATHICTCVTLCVSVCVCVQKLTKHWQDFGSSGNIDIVTGSVMLTMERVTKRKKLRDDTIQGKAYKLRDMRGGKKWRKHNQHHNHHHWMEDCSMVSAIRYETHTHKWKCNCKDEVEDVS